MTDVRDAPAAGAARTESSPDGGSFIWYELMTPDPEGAKAFYDAVVGWNIGEGAPEFDGYRMIGRSDGGFAGGVLPLTPEMQQHGARPTWLGYLHVADTDEAVRSVEAAGGKAPKARENKPEVKEGVVETPGVPAEKPFDPAAWMHERIVRQIMEFEKNLGPDHEVGGRFVEGLNNESLHITNVASWGPDMIMFLGEWPDGRKFELLQHYSQVSVLLVAVPKMMEEPRRIGFELIKTVKEQDHPWGDPAI
jgi:predicted enzyme related to lactoylglutathione lyase